MAATGYSRVFCAIRLLITVCLFSFPAYAKYSGGTGEPNDPYQIATAEDLMLLGESPEDYDKHFILTADIDLDPNLPGRKIFERAVIAPDTDDVQDWFQGTCFNGIFDGNSHMISHLTIAGNSFLGLFGQLGSEAKVSNLGLGIVDVEGIGDNVGGLVGYNDGSITLSHSTGAVEGYLNVGGLAGYNSGNITKSYSTGTVSGHVGVGGLVGLTGGRISMNYSTSTVIGDTSVGGLVGYNNWESLITTSYSTGAVSGSSYTGGLVGINDYWDSPSILNCYSTSTVTANGNIGGIVARGGGGVLQCVWDVNTSGISEGEGGVGLTTDEMMNPDVLGLNGFAEDANWVLNPGLDYPRLAWEGTVGQIIPEPNIDWMEGHGTIEEPHRIDKAEQLILFDKASIFWDRHFILVADINLDPNLTYARVFDQAVIPQFFGVFDGNNLTVSHLTIEGKSHLGLFGGLELGAEVKNLGVVDVNITASGDHVGGLVGYNRGGAISTSYSTGLVAGNESVGGLVGSNASYPYSATITNCYSTCTVRGNESVGGLAGANNGDGTIACCFAICNVQANKTGGGLVGINCGSDPYYVWSWAIVSDCYSFTMEGSQVSGLLVGQNSRPTGPDATYAPSQIKNCYAACSGSGMVEVSGLVGMNWWDGWILDCFWDAEACILANSTEWGTAKTTPEIQTASTFLDAGWDFVEETVNGPNDIWKMWDGYGYPRLAWEAGPNTPLVFVDINDPGFYGQMSRYEVTNAQFCDFLNAASASGDITVSDTDIYGASGSNSGDDYIGQRYYRCDGSGYTGYGATNGGAARIHYNEGAFSVDEGFGNHPVTYVSWYGAMAFANYYGYYLPAEDQWQAVADYDGTYIYGCGQMIDTGIANYRPSEHPDGTMPVGSFGAYGYGMSDMAGNVWEWTSSSLDSNRVFRGGSLGSIDSDCDVSIRGDGIPYANYYDIGFRVCH